MNNTIFNRIILSADIFTRKDLFEANTVEKLLLAKHGPNGIVIQNTTRNYSKQTGEVLSKQHGISSQYKFMGDELYVRARVTSTADHIDPITGKVIGIQRAWVQPKLPGN